MSVIKRNKRVKPDCSSSHSFAHAYLVIAVNVPKQNFSTVIFSAMKSQSYSARFFRFAGLPRVGIAEGAILFCRQAACRRRLVARLAHMPAPVPSGKIADYPDKHPRPPTF